MAYAPQIRSWIILWPCKTYADGTRRLIADPTLSCDTPTHNVFQGLSVAFLALIGVGIPAYLLFRLKPRKQQVIASRFLWDLYRPECPWWDAVIQLRKLLMLAVLAATATQPVDLASKYQSAILLAISIAYLVAIIVFRPFAPEMLVPSYSIWHTDIAHPLELFASVVQVTNSLLARSLTSIRPLSETFLWY